MKVPILSLYSLSLSIIALAYLIPSLLKIFSKSKRVGYTLEIRTVPLDRFNEYKKAVDKNNFGIRILKILKGTNELKIFFVNSGEKLIKLQCEGLNNNAKLEIEEIDTDISHNETGVIIVTDKNDDLNEVELLFKYFTEQKYYKTKHVKINIATKEINIVE